MKTPDCTCYSDNDKKLRSQHQLQFHDNSLKLYMIGLSIVSQVGMPLQTTEGKKPKVYQEDFMSFGFCPWCGKPYKDAIKTKDAL